jgi:uncharacterized cupredoxin-like copper-binding protein
MGSNARVLLAALLGVAVIMVAGCAGRYSATVQRGEKELAVRASNFKFEPNEIKAQRGGVVVFHVENVTGTAHNFTLKDPSGQTIASVALPPEGTADVKVGLDEPGSYEFYCNKPFHAILGMRGRIEVSGAR